ncbi:MAG: 50S ribosomal protein L21 [Gammaproteobacteria bacterium]|nr:50S ribosomal protein L21 [Gammaproteobacteria bacterium]
MYAVILTGGKQYKVKEGDRIKIAMLNADEGKKVDFDKVLMIVDGEKVSIGTPYIKDALVGAEVIKHGRHKKIRIIKFRRRKHHMKHAGHRQYYTEVEIKKIPGSTKKESAPEKSAPKESTVKVAAKEKEKDKKKAPQKSSAKETAKKAVTEKKVTAKKVAKVAEKKR